MDVFTAIKQRRSIRKYLDRQAPEAVIMEILEAARLAPSAKNRQDWRFIVVRDREQIQKLTAATGQPFVGGAPVIIAAVALDPNWLLRSEIPPYAVDLAIALTNISLAAVAKGLGTCWIGSFMQAEVKKALAIPEDYKVVELMTLGYPAEEPEARPRKQLTEIISFDRF